MKTKMILTAALSALAACIPVNVLAAPSEAAANAPAVVVTDEENGEKTVVVSTEIDEEPADTYSFSYTATEEGAEGSISVLGENDEFDNLTEEETAELKDLFAQEAAIFNEILEENPEITDEEFDAALDERQPELDRIQERITELLEKAGAETVFSFDDEADDCYSCICVTDENGEIKITAGDDDDISLSDDEIAEFFENGCVTKSIYISDEE